MPEYWWKKPTRVRATEIPDRVVKRFLSRLKAHPTTDCILWPKGGRGKNNEYGSIRVGPRVITTHRLAFALFYGECPALYIDHVCQTTLCCNPFHLEAVTMEVNTKRSNVKMEGYYGRDEEEVIPEL